jgi:hypothetical protein
MRERPTYFAVRGDPWAGETPAAANAPHLASALQQAFSESGQRPDAIFSAHAHLFQRLSYRFADGTIMPCVIVGSGGHSLENMFTRCDGGRATPRSVPFPAVIPQRFAFPEGDSAQVEAYQDDALDAWPAKTAKGGRYGFIRVEVQEHTLACTFFRATGKPSDSFTLDLDTHQYVPPAANA